MKFTLFTTEYAGNASNCVYPHKKVVVGENSLMDAAQYDHVTAEYKNCYRSTDNFVSADNVPMDCDNSETDDEGSWVTPEDVRATFPDVAFAVVYSRNHMKEKNGKAPRPKFHVYFPITPVTDVKAYGTLKHQIAAMFPHFDANALDSARFLFGTKEPRVELFEGSKTIDALVDEGEFRQWEESLVDIPEGKRNNTMSHFAGKVLKRFGNTDKAYDLFLEQAEKCTPPLEDSELSKIWASALKFCAKVENQEGYIPPEEFNQEFTLKPKDFSDVGQAEVMSHEYLTKLRYSPATGYMIYNSSFWEESEPKSQAIAQELTYRQLEEAENEIKKVSEEMVGNGAWELLAAMGPKKAALSMNEAQKHTFEKYQNAIAYRNFAIKRRDSKYIFSALKEVRPMLEINPTHLDADEFILNTPSATYDLRKGPTKPMEHDPMQLLTKQTATNPGNRGRDIWLETLNTIFQKDADLIEYVQELAGLAAIGKVYEETLIISYGDGRNGKSTFWNVISKVLGTYSGSISADILTSHCKRNPKPELAEAKSKRLLIAAELEEGRRLDTSIVKQLCSTDNVRAEKKFKAPFDFSPTHTLVLYTNHLPRVGAIDVGTWRRLSIIPFGAKIEGKSDIKNYGDYLFQNAAEAVLTWIMEGALRVIAHDMKPPRPSKVLAANEAYMESNNWINHFLEDCCNVGEELAEKSGEVYSTYRTYCNQNGEYPRGCEDFYKALQDLGIEKFRKKNGRFLKGLSLKTDFE